MFNKKRVASFSRIDSLIGKNCVFEGTIKSGGTLRIDGKIKGGIVSDGNVFLSNDSRILGDVKASHILISGEVNGDVTATESLRITSSGRLLGNSHSKVFILDENAKFEGESKQYIENTVTKIDKKETTTTTGNHVKKQEKK
ncbi:MAG: bactofilin family protein [Alkaliphilus sp.]